MENKKIEEEIQLLKKEVYEIKELLKNNSNSNIGKGSDFDYSKYKNVANSDDLEKMINFNKYKPVWSIPIVGYYWFMADMQINLETIDRGLVRSELVRTQWKFFLILIPISIISIFINIWPFFEIKLIRRITEKKIRKIMENEEK